MVVSSGLNATEITPLLPGSARATIGLPVATFHRYARPLPSPAARILPSGLNATEFTPLLPESARATIGLPVATFHRYARPLPSPAARILPSGLNATEYAPSLPGSVKVPVWLPVATSHRYVLPLLSVAARVLPSGLNAIAVMLAFPKLTVQWAAAISHRQIFSEAMASVVPDGLKAIDAMGTKRQAAGRPTGTRR